MTKVSRILVPAFAIVLLMAAWANVPQRNSLPANARIDHLLVLKHRHVLIAYSNGVALKTYRVSLGRGGLTDKQHAGDNRVPEGTYRIAAHNPHSAFHRALRVSYPTLAQQQDAQRAGIDPGGDIMVHGIRNGLGWLGRLQRTLDWTKGCIALTDPEIDELYRATPDGTLIEIRP